MVTVPPAAITSPLTGALMVMEPPAAVMLRTGAFTSIMPPVAKTSSGTGSRMFTWFPEYVTSAETLTGSARRASKDDYQELLHSITGL